MTGKILRSRLPLLTAQLFAVLAILLFSGCTQCLLESAFKLPPPPPPEVREHPVTGVNSALIFDGQIFLEVSLEGHSDKWLKSLGRTHFVQPNGQLAPFATVVILEPQDGPAPQEIREKSTTIPINPPLVCAELPDLFISDPPLSLNTKWQFGRRNVKFRHDGNQIRTCKKNKTDPNLCFVRIIPDRGTWMIYPFMYSMARTVVLLPFAIAGDVLTSPLWLSGVDPPCRWRFGSP